MPAGEAEGIPTEMGDLGDMILGEKNSENFINFLRSQKAKKPQLNVAAVCVKLARCRRFLNDLILLPFNIFESLF